MFEFDHAGQSIGIVAWVVGAPYAVLLAEQMAASFCRLLVSITSSGQLKPIAATPYYVLVERALRDEGTSYHYQPPADYAEADPGLIAPGIGDSFVRAAYPVPDVNYYRASSVNTLSAGHPE